MSQLSADTLCFLIRAIVTFNSELIGSHSKVFRVHLVSYKELVATDYSQSLLLHSGNLLIGDCLEQWGNVNTHYPGLFSSSEDVWVFSWRQQLSHSVTMLDLGFFLCFVLFLFSTGEF